MFPKMHYFFVETLNKNNMSNLPHQFKYNFFNINITFLKIQNIFGIKYSGLIRYTQFHENSVCNVIGIYKGRTSYRNFRYHVYSQDIYFKTIKMYESFMIYTHLNL